MIIKVQKWGNSLAVRIPKAFASQLHIEPGSEIDLSLEKGQLVIKPNDSPVNSAHSLNGIPGGDALGTKKEYSLDELLSNISEPDLLYKVDTNAPVEPRPISNLQLEILKLYSTHLNGNELQELKTFLAGYFAKKAVHEADDIWEKQNLSNDDMDQWLNGQS